MRRAFLSLLLFLFVSPTNAAEPLPGTKPLTRDGDLAAQMVEGIDKYLMRELESSIKTRQQLWKIEATITEKDYLQDMKPRRQRPPYLPTS